ncbi:MAG: PEP-CTERM sorting domain-containing protein [Phenylobacterium sp.]|uniref:PEPxxWA-CTERM sorting domain-containing protein n=1 Tax=Phenylobacterium sp. TaxID=1871053 RepID=UPI001A1E56DA|nr:PEPxxWA-CTERM sorting domain-containing protein [Phenylobacterium sp.]MBJ7410108.1 PEP-CTERM sorting domain-containing protein [Phenylobacterium sp.]
MRTFFLVLAFLLFGSSANAAVITGSITDGTFGLSLLRYLHHTGSFSLTANFSQPIEGGYMFTRQIEYYNETGKIGDNYYNVGGNDHDYIETTDFTPGSLGVSASGYFVNENYVYNLSTFYPFDQILKRGYVKTKAAYLSFDFAAGTEVDYRIEITGPATVPEPGTWALMILGFGAVGIAARRRSIKVA